MIYKLTFQDGRIDYCTAKSELHLLKSYDSMFDLALQEIESLETVSEAEANTLMIHNTEYNPDDPEDKEEFSLAELAYSDDFALIASSEYG